MRKVSIIFVCILALFAFFSWTHTANAFPSLYASECAACHGGAVSGFSPATGTCAGCHAHGTHSGTGAEDINITATPDKLVYAPGETVAVTINGGTFTSNSAGEYGGAIFAVDSNYLLAAPLSCIVDGAPFGRRVFREAGIGE